MASGRDRERTVGWPACRTSEFPNVHDSLPDTSLRELETFSRWAPRQKPSEPLADVTGFVPNGTGTDCINRWTPRVLITASTTTRIQRAAIPNLPRGGRLLPAKRRTIPSAETAGRTIVQVQGRQQSMPGYPPSTSTHPLPQPEARRGRSPSAQRQPAASARPARVPRAKMLV
jgi:hypothetical protein